jgi:integrase
MLQALRPMRKRKQRDAPPPDLIVIAGRRRSLLRSRFASDYNQQKLRDAEALEQFFPFLPQVPTPTLMDCTPQDVLYYLIHTSYNGRTVVHTRACPRNRGCQCPRWKAQSSLDSLVGKLRAVFNYIGRTLANNPCADPEIREFLKDTAREQQLGGVFPAPAVPVFQDKVAHVLAAIDAALASGRLTNFQRFMNMRDAAAIAVDSASGQRGRDLLSLRVSGIISFPGDNGLVLGFEWGKTLRSGTRHHFGIRTRPDARVLCPVRRLMDYIDFGLRIGVPFRNPGAFIFPAVRYTVIDVTRALNSINPSLTWWLRHLEIYENETAYGLRPAFAIESALHGQALAHTMDICQWRSRAMHDRYTRLREIIVLDPTTPLTAQHYRDLNVLRGAVQAFVTTPPDDPEAPGTPPGTPPAE